MVDFDRKMAATPELSPRSLPPTLSKPDHDQSSSATSPFPPRVQDAAAASYERYLRLPELSKLWSSKDFPEWRNESILKPALQALEITFRLISIALSDPRPYANRREWKRRLESLATHQIELIATVCEEEEEEEESQSQINLHPAGTGARGAPISDLRSFKGVLSRESSCQEVWLQLPGATVVSRTSEASLLPRLAAWDKSKEVASKILLQIESQLQGCAFTLGLGEPNLASKPTLDYDLLVRPQSLHALISSSSSNSSNSNIKKSPGGVENVVHVVQEEENRTLFTIHQILESWLFAARGLLTRIGERIDGEDWDKAASDCWLLERIWRLLSEMEDLHLLMDPDDFLRLKSQLGINATSVCFRSAALLEVTNSSRDLKRRVPWILGVEVDPKGGPRVQEAAMGLFHSRRRGQGGNACRIHLLQALQAVEAAVKGFFFAYRQLVAAVMGSLEATGNRGSLCSSPWESLDSLSQLFMEPPYYPSLDAAKTFLGNFWQQNPSTTRYKLN